MTGSHEARGSSPLFSTRKTPLNAGFFLFRVIFRGISSSNIKGMHIAVRSDGKSKPPSDRLGSFPFHLFGVLEAPWFFALAFLVLAVHDGLQYLLPPDFKVLAATYAIFPHLHWHSQIIDP